MFSMLEFILGIFVALILGIVLQFTLLACPDCPEVEVVETKHAIFTDCDTGDSLFVPFALLRGATIQQSFGGECYILQITRGGITDRWEQFFSVKENPLLMLQEHK